MVKRNDGNIAPQLNEQRSRNATGNTGQALSSGREFPTKYNINEDLIVSLENAYENRRARQVTEWERRQRVAAAF